MSQNAPRPARPLTSLNSDRATGAYDHYGSPPVTDQPSFPSLELGNALHSFKKFAFTAKRLQQMASATITWSGLFAKIIVVWPVFDLIFFVVRHFMVTKLAVAFLVKSTK
jgi:hypothetical protein